MMTSRDLTVDPTVRADIAATVIFAITATYAAVVFDATAQWIGAITAMVLFAIGVVAFFASLTIAAGRSRTVQMSVAELYLLMGPGVPSEIRRIMNTTLVMQFVIAAVTTFARPNGPNGNPGSSLAVGFLVPMLGFGLNGLWAARHAQFAVRSDVRPLSTHSDQEIRQNAKHG